MNNQRQDDIRLSKHKRFSMEVWGGWGPFASLGVKWTKLTLWKCVSTSTTQICLDEGVCKPSLVPVVICKDYFGGQGLGSPTRHTFCSCEQLMGVRGTAPLERVKHTKDISTYSLFKPNPFTSSATIRMWMPLDRPPTSIAIIHMYSEMGWLILHIIVITYATI
jgi:hypothetical protein